LTGTANQIEWAERIRTQVDAEFDRVSGLLGTAARKQSAQKRSDTRIMMAILAEKRAAVMANREAGYFIHDWQELRDQVRKLIMDDARYKAMKGRPSIRL
jgi:hypothetical protein